MWVEELKLFNIKCFEDATLRFSQGNEPIRWVTFLSENGGGKSTALQALALLLAGPESTQKLLQRPLGWLRDESKTGLISTRIHQGEHDPGQYGEEKVTRAFGYSYHVTGSNQLTLRNRVYTEPAFIENNEKRSPFLRQNAFRSLGEGWFAVGYGAFRRLTRSSQIIIPSLEPQARFTNFTTQFNEDEPLSMFERWMVYLDYRIAKAGDSDAERKKAFGIQAINDLLPEGVAFEAVTEEGRICFNVGGSIVPTVALSDGYRSILALAGDLVWRLINAFPNSGNPLLEAGVVLIDELDIHLHPIWQRQIAQMLRRQFPNLQFIVATHSPLIAAGAGEDALTLKFTLDNGKARVEKIQDLNRLKVDDILTSEAFCVLSPYSPQTQEKMDRYDDLMRKGARRTLEEQQEQEHLSLFMKEINPLRNDAAPNSLEARIDEYLRQNWDNLLLACGKCNSSTYKGDRFPKTWEGGLLLNPCLDEPEDHLAFVYDSVAGLASVTGKTARGTTTERILGLNRPELREYRSKFVKKLAALSRLATEDNEAAQLIVEASVDSEEYAAFAKALQQASKGKT